VSVLYPLSFKKFYFKFFYLCWKILIFNFLYPMILKIVYFKFFLFFVVEKYWREKELTKDCLLCEKSKANREAQQIEKKKKRRQKISRQYFSLSLSVSLLFSLSPFFFSVFLSSSLSLSLSFSLPLFLSPLFLCLSRFLSPSLTLSLSFSLPLFLSVLLSLSFYLSFSPSLSICPSLPLSFWSLFFLFFCTSQSNYHIVY